MKIKLVFIAFLVSMVSWGQTTLPVSRTAWGSTPTGWTDNGTQRSTSFACSGSDGGSMQATNKYYKVWFSGTPNQLNYSIKGSNPTSGSFKVQESVDGSTWTDVASYTSITGSSCVNEVKTLLSTTRYVQFVYLTKTSGNVDIDDVSITTVSSTPTITVTPTTLTGFTYIVGNGPSTNQTFTASGSNLTSNITLTAPTDYEISLASGSGFGSSLSLTQSSGTVGTTTIYTRLKSGLAVGSYNTETITATSTGATTQNVTCSGTVTASSISDLVAVSGSSPSSISSTVNDAAPLTSSTGVQVWQFNVRDGGASLSDTDNLPTILTAFNIAQVSNSVSTWSDAINTVALFDGTTFIASGTVTATQIQFSGLSVSVPDNTQKTLSLRMSLKCPLGSGAADSNHFGFSISNTNTTFSTTGSGKTTFTAITNQSSTNTIAVVATKLAFSTQPSSTGVSAAMSTVTVTATDACGNVDTGFTGTVSLTSTGTMTGTTLTATAVAGVATFSNIVHTIVGTNYTLNATASGVTSITSNTFDIFTTTTLEKGDLAILAVNVDMGSGTDEIAFVCFKDILPGTTFYLTDNGYQREFAGQWGGTEGLLSITRTGTTLTKGTIVVIETSNGNVTSSTQYDVYTCGSIDTNWTKTALGGGSIGGFNLNVDDDIWIMQGGAWTNDTSHHSTYNGTVLYGWTESGWDSGVGNGVNGTKWSSLLDEMECYTTNVSGNAKVKFNDPVNPDFSTTTNGRYDWISLINNSANWDTYTDNTTYNAGGYDYKNSTSCPAMTIATNTYVDGKWTGNKDTNWFNCGNWNTLKVPDETVDVQVEDNVLNRQAIIDNTAMYATTYGNIAKAKNLTISGEKVEIVGSSNNKLEIHGDLIIETNGALDMDDSTTAADGQIYLYGNWTNSVGNSAFQEGNGTVQLVGSIQQVISNVTPEGTETFYNVILDNDFETKQGNSIIASGDLTINANKTLKIGANNYVKVQNNLTVNTGATVDILHEGSLVMVNDLGIVTNNGTMDAKKSTTPYEKYDYTYWSSPMDNITIGNPLGGWNNNYTFKFEAANFSDITTAATGAAPADGFDDNQDAWVSVSQTDVMQKGKGYASMAPTTGTFPAVSTVIFTGTVNNGVITTPIALSANNASNIDDYNLIGNPYPSAIFADSFIQKNAIDASNISGTLYFWTHIQDISAANPGPNAYNFRSDDYATYNLTGGTSPSASDEGIFNSYIASGQGFFVEAEANSNVTFNNAMRDVSFNNQFYKNGNQNIKDRVWVSMQNDTGIFSQQLVGYIQGTTLDYDRAYDGLRNKVNTYLHFYSHLNNDEYKIQSRGDFDVNDQVILGYQTEYAGQFKIKIDKIEGALNSAEVNVFLEDKLLNITHNLKESDYVFSTEIGKFDNRFVLRYTDRKLGNDDFENIENNVIVANSNQEIKVKSQLEPIKNIMVYDILGRTIFERNNINNTEFSIQNIAQSQQALIIKVVLENGQTVTRKIVL